MNAFSIIEPTQIALIQATDSDAATALNNAMASVIGASPSAIILLITYIRETTGDTTCIITCMKNTGASGFTLYKGLSLEAP